MGRIHHARYVEYFEIGRTEYMRAMGHSYADVEKMGMYLVLTEVHLNYRKPALYDMEIDITTRLRDLSHVRVTFEYIIANGADTLCEGWTTLACTGRDGKPMRIPESLRTALEGTGR
jgi:acyl-CoA thioester hydrolase